MPIPRNSPATTDAARGFVLVVLAYRCAMGELTGTDTKYRAGAWEVLEAAAPDGEAETLFAHMFGFARALLAVAERPLDWRRATCAHLCRDEWLAVSMIAAAQRVDVASLLESASQLIGVEALGDALGATQTLASELSRRGLYLCPRGGGAACVSDLCPKRTLH